MVRCGIAIYGLSPFQGDAAADGLRPALRLTSYLADIKELAEGDSVGYGCTWTAPRRTHIGIVPIGYGDGFNRRLSNQGRALIGGRSYPVVGRVSMDQITVDLGPITGRARRRRSRAHRHDRKTRRSPRRRWRPASAPSITKSPATSLRRVERRYTG